MMDANDTRICTQGITRLDEMLCSKPTKTMHAIKWAWPPVANSAASNRSPSRSRSSVFECLGNIKWQQQINQFVWSSTYYPNASHSGLDRAKKHSGD
jgi:hypothetical protein